MHYIIKYRVYDYFCYCVIDFTYVVSFYQVAEFDLLWRREGSSTANLCIFERLSLLSDNMPRVMKNAYSHSLFYKKT